MQQMRRKDRELSELNAITLLEQGEFGTLATVSVDGFPHAVALHYVLLNGRLYFHCAKEGLKLDNIRAQPKVCFSVVIEYEVLRDAVSTAYQSVTVYGKAAVVENQEERVQVLAALMRKYTAMNEAMAEAYAHKRASEPIVVGIAMEKISGKCRPKS